MRELSLSDFGLMTTADAAALRGWPVKTLQNWAKAGLLPVLVLGVGRGSIYLFRRSDVAEFEPPVHTVGRPPAWRKTGASSEKPAGKKVKGK